MVPVLEPNLALKALHVGRIEVPQLAELELCDLGHHTAHQSANHVLMLFLAVSLDVSHLTYAWDCGIQIGRSLPTLHLRTWWWMMLCKASGTPRNPNARELKPVKGSPLPPPVGVFRAVFCL